MAKEIENRDAPFWRVKSLAEMSAAEWEALCDNCGRCCLVKLEDEDTGEIHTTNAVCRLFDGKTCRCRDYANRHRRVSDCIKLDADIVGELSWLPATCAYRRLAAGGALDWWHPLVSGCQQTVIDAGISVQGQVIGEQYVAEADLPGLIRDWPKWREAS